jgi:histidinol dehydrogenase
MMDIIPAQVAGVAEIVVATPPQRADGPQAASTLGVLHHLDITEVYTVGGAQALAALALGTEAIAPVDKIVGPGNSFVNEAKRLLYGVVDIDSLAGPSEILVIADETTRPEYVAADLLSQAEHSPDAQSLLVVVGDESLLQKFTDEVTRQAELLPRVEIVKESLECFGTAVLVDSIEEAIAFTNWKAPEHLEILTREAADVAMRVKNSGAIFVGEYTPEAVCDYVAGPNHVLPTGGTARYFSGLNTASFMKGMNITQMSRDGLKACAPHVETLATTEGLDAHARSAMIRFQPDGNDA